MSRFSKLSHVIWHCQYHLIWVPKYRYRVLEGRVGYEVEKNIRIYTERLGCTVVELNVQPDHIPDQGAAEGVNFEIDGYSKRKDCVTDIQAVFAFENEALLGQSFLGEGLLC